MQMSWTFKISANKLATIVFPGYTHSGKIDRDGRGSKIRPKPSKKRTLRVGKKRMRKILDKLTTEL